MDHRSCSILFIVHPTDRFSKKTSKQECVRETIYQEEGRLSGELDRERLRHRDEELREPEWERERERDPLLVQQKGLLGDRRREDGGETDPREGEQLDGGELEGERGE